MKLGNIKIEFNVNGFYLIKIRIVLIEIELIWVLVLLYIYDFILLLATLYLVFQLHILSM